MLPHVFSNPVTHGVFIMFPAKKTKGTTSPQSTVCRYQRTTITEVLKLARLPSTLLGLWTGSVKLTTVACLVGFEILPQ